MNIRDLIGLVRNELADSQRERERSGQDALFVLDRFELELNCTLVKQEGSKAGLDLKILTAGDSESTSSQMVQRVKLSFRAPSPGSRSELPAASVPMAVSVPSSLNLPLGALPSQHR